MKTDTSESVPVIKKRNRVQTPLTSEVLRKINYLRKLINDPKNGVKEKLISQQPQAR